MTTNYAAQHKKLSRAIMSALPTSASKKTREFVEQFYTLTTVPDLESLAPARAAAIALACEKFYTQRTTPEPKIEIHSTTINDGGRARARTEIRVLNDDMPFLVDSLSALFSGLGFTTHRILHPILTTTRDAKGLRATPGKTSARESLIYAELSGFRRASPQTHLRA